MTLPNLPFVPSPISPSKLTCPVPAAIERLLFPTVLPSTVPLKVTFAPLTLPIVVSTLVAAASVTLPSISTAPADVVKLPFVVIFGAVYVCTPDVFILTTLKFAAVTFTELRA